MMETIEVIHTNEVSGVSKLKLLAFLYLADEIQWLMP